MKIKAILHFYSKKNPQFSKLNFSDCILKKLDCLEITLSVRRILNIHTAEKNINYSIYQNAVFAKLNIYFEFITGLLLRQDNEIP